MTKRYPALINGQPATARKNGKTWMVGGDFVQPGQSIQVMTTKNGQPAWYSLRGGVLRFSDFASKQEIISGYTEVAKAHRNAMESVPVRVAVFAKEAAK